MQRYVARFEDGSDADGKLLSASIALFETQPFATLLILHALKAAGASLCPAMRADNAIGPNDRFQLIESRSLVCEVGLLENVWHSASSEHGSYIAISMGFVKPYIAKIKIYVTIIGRGNLVSAVDITVVSVPVRPLCNTHRNGSRCTDSLN
jgi:hypothetical protein